MNPEIQDLKIISADLPYWDAKLASLERDVKDRGLALQAAEERLTIAKEKLSTAKRITKWVDGVPIVVEQFNRNVEVWTPASHRRGSVYKNAHNLKTWGVNIQELWYNANGHRWLGSGKWLGSQRETKKGAIEEIVQWILTGKIPTKELLHTRA